MKTLIKLNALLLIVLLSAAMFVASCKKDSTSTPVDYKSLDSLIVVATALSTSATTTDYPQAAITSYNTTLTSVKTARATNPDQTATNNLNTQLGEAIKTFKAQAYGFIDESLYLNAGWHFDEGTGTTATAFSNTKHVATFAKGMTPYGVAGTVLPTWVDGVKGGKAIKLSGGAHLEVPFNPLFLPVDITISVWVKVDDNVFPDNYIVSQNYWQGYKMQTQDHGKSFLTVATSPTSIKDLDNGTDFSVPNATWTHLVVSLSSTNKIEKFYVNGILLKTYTASDGVGPLTRAPVHGPDNALVAGNLPFIIGAAATDADIVANAWTWYGQLSFKGVLDELKIYNIALSDGQVSKLYSNEKP